MATLDGRLFNGEKELDLRYEFDEFFKGEDFSEHKGIIFVHRKLNRDPVTGAKTRCSCNTSLNNTGQKGCPYCDGIGYIWTERVIESYLYNKRYISFTSSYSFEKSFSRAFNEQYVFLTRHKIKIEEGDHLYELKKDDSGRVQIPLRYYIEFLITANRYMGFDHNIGEFTLAVGEIVNRNDYVTIQPV